MWLSLLLLLACGESKDSNRDTALTCVDVLQLTDHETADGDPAGVEYCWIDDANGGAFDRTETVDCTTDFGLSWCDPTVSDTTACASDADCDPGWSCLTGEWWDDYACGCVHTCTSDADCGDTEACVCPAALLTEGGSYLYAGFRRECQPAQCHTDADCGEHACGISKDVCNWGIDGLYCRTNQDKCRTDADCQDSDDGNFCQYSPSLGHWTCAWSATCE